MSPTGWAIPPSCHVLLLQPALALHVSRGPEAGSRTPSQQQAEALLTLCHAPQPVPTVQQGFVQGAAWFSMGPCVVLRVKVGVGCGACAACRLPQWSRGCRHKGCRWFGDRCPRGSPAMPSAKVARHGDVPAAAMTRTCRQGVGEVWISDPITGMHCRDCMLWLCPRGCCTAQVSSKQISSLIC